MAKRFTDTEKWRDEWWGSLTNDYRMIWLYLVDSCSIAGIWKKDFRGLNFNCNTNISEEDFLRVFGERLVDKGNFFFIPKFLRFQCPKGLNSNKPAIVSIVKELENNNLIQTVIKSLGNDFLIIKDKGKGKGTDKGKEEGKDKGRYIVIGDEEITDPLPILEFYEAQLNSSMREMDNIAWKPLVSFWFDQHIGEQFKDNMHVKNSFKKYYMGQGKMPFPRENVIKPKRDISKL
jgi:hypothetical protein